MNHPEMMQEIRRFAGMEPASRRPAYLKRLEAARLLRFLQTLELRKVIPPRGPKSDECGDGTQRI